MKTKRSRKREDAPPAPAEKGDKKGDKGSTNPNVPVIPTIEELDALTKVALEAWMSIKSPSFNAERYTEFSVEEKGDRKIVLITKEDIDAIDPPVVPPVLFKDFRKNIDFG